MCLDHAFGPACAGGDDFPDKYATALKEAGGAFRVKGRGCTESVASALLLDMVTESTDEDGECGWFDTLRGVLGGTARRRADNRAR